MTTNLSLSVTHLKCNQLALQLNNQHTCTVREGYVLTNVIIQLLNGPPVLVLTISTAEDK